MNTAALHGAEFRRCLERLDVAGIMKLWKHAAPHLPQPETPAAALISLHMARVDAKSIHVKLRKYSRDWLAERGYEKDRVTGEWKHDSIVRPVIAESVGIAVKSKYEAVQKRIYSAMYDALQNERAKGVTDPLKQRKAMLDAREKQRFKLRMA